MFRLVKKIQKAKRVIKKWSLEEWNGEWDQFEKDILEAQLILENEGKEEEFIKASKRLEEYSRNLATYWRQRAKINWDYAGDTCSRYFFNFVKGRRARNKLEAIKDEQGAWVTGEQDIANIAGSYFKDLYGCNSSIHSQDTQQRSLEIQQVLRGIKTTLTEDQRDLLSKPYTRSEVRDALFAMKPWKAPGPDGVPAGFGCKMTSLRLCCPASHQVTSFAK
ncbi:uncharacterized protein LOC110723640 [Chenopodium quinoa]|uniref:uncharacterized protein LOC110723640 n=1 Tax=Chenopodium quinoa TaxID=63459 RepID=UPI000B76E424|nr:uncharacterized protein LOC110723640 [Chenopodium quinoa]